MTTSVSITGAGQSGPVAALALARAGYDVTVYERRNEEDLHSYGVIGIVPENVARLREIGADLSLVELDNSYSEWNGGNVVTSQWGGSYVMWTDLHQLTMSAARDAGARFLFGTDAPLTPEGFTVQATGITTAARELAWDYSGYMVYRGLSKLDTDFAWLAFDDPDKRFAFKLAHSPLGASWEMYAHRELPADLRSIPQTELPAERQFMPDQFRQVIEATRELIVAPISDFEQRSMMLDWNRFSIGDANGAQRPHTGMGANLGIIEAMVLPELVTMSPEIQAKTAQQILARRNFQHDRGIRMGQKLLGS